MADDNKTRRLELLQMQMRAKSAATPPRVDLRPQQGEDPAAYRDRVKAVAREGFTPSSGHSVAMPTFEPGVWDDVAQVGAGTQEGIAPFLGFPVDAVTGAINGTGQLTGLWDPIQNPVGGAQFWDSIISPVRAGVPDPQNDRQRFLRRVGEEVGASAAGLPLAMVGGGSRAANAGVELASGLGSGLGAATAEYFAPDSAVAEIAGQLAGGIPAGMAASRVLGVGSVAPEMAEASVEAQRQRAADAYGSVRADQSRLPVADTEDLGIRIADRMKAERMRPELNPYASSVAKVLADDLGTDLSLIGPTQGLRVEDIEDLRRILGQSVPVTAAPADQRLVGIMRDELTGYLDGLNMPSTEALREGRDATRRYKAAEAVQEAVGKAERRAASTGSGGNEVNAVRQNLRAMLDSPAKRRSFTADELRQMEDIVRGTGSENMLRRLSRMAPSSGGLAGMLGMGGVVASPYVAAPAIAVTEVAKAAAERGSRKNVDALVRSLLGERMLSPGKSGADEVARALLLGRIVNEEE